MSPRRSFLIVNRLKILDHLEIKFAFINQDNIWNEIYLYFTKITFNLKLSIMVSLHEILNKRLLYNFDRISFLEKCEISKSKRIITKYRGFIFEIIFSRQSFYK